MAVPHEDHARAVRAAVDVFYDRVLDDPVLAPRFAGIDMHRLRAHQRSFLVAALVGGEQYRGRPLREAHHGLGIDDEEFDRAVQHLDAALRESRAPEGSIARLCAQIESLRHLVVER